MQFVPYPKTPRLKRSVVFTEKIDGTNAQVVIVDCQDDRVLETMPTFTDNGLAFYVGSRNRWISPGKSTDNFGFAAWVGQNLAELAKLGIGQHFGEWYGQGIGRGYGLTERRFALFNTARWGKHNPNTPACCEAVPVLHIGDLSDVDNTMRLLRTYGSVAAPGYFNVEGLIAFHTASGGVFKVLAENDDTPKGLVTS